LVTAVAWTRWAGDRRRELGVKPAPVPFPCELGVFRLVVDEGNKLAASAAVEYAVEAGFDIGAEGVLLARGHNRKAPHLPEIRWVAIGCFFIPQFGVPTRFRFLVIHFHRLDDRGLDFIFDEGVWFREGISTGSELVNCSTVDMLGRVLRSTEVLQRSDMSPPYRMWAK